MPETYLTQLPLDQPYEVYDKVDGSLGILYKQHGQWKIATAGSFFSDQAIEATKMLNEKYDVSALVEGITYLFEIIYPANKIVVDYKGQRDLILLAAFETASGVEQNYLWLEEAAYKLGCPIVAKYSYTIDQMIELQKTLPKDCEGFVVKFANGVRAKIKGEEYLKIHRAISGMSPLSIWSDIQKPNIEELKKQLPEELLPEYEEIEAKLRAKYAEMEREILAEGMKYFPNLMIRSDMMTATDRKMIGLTIKDKGKEMKHASAMFPLFLRQGLKEYIYERIRPKANLL